MGYPIAVIQKYNVVSLLCVFSRRQSYLVSNSAAMQEIEIKRGKFGLGAFAVDYIRKGGFIGGTSKLFSASLTRQ